MDRRKTSFRKWISICLVVVGVASVIAVTAARSSVVESTGFAAANSVTGASFPVMTLAISATTTTCIPHVQVIGSSVAGRPIELHTFGEGRWRVLIVGGVHGDEHGGPVARALLEHLEEHPEDVPEEAFLQVVPSANPDGEAADTRGNANKVDINRNFPSDNWKSRLNAGDRPTTGLTGGVSPGSEPETKALLSILDEEWDVIVALHSSGGIICPDSLGGQDIVERMSDLSGFPIKALSYQSHITGSLGVYAPERYRVPVITIELKSSKLSTGILAALLTSLTPD